jgi:hypothetical protein
MQGRTFLPFTKVSKEKGENSAVPVEEDETDIESSSTGITKGYHVAAKEKVVATTFPLHRSNCPALEHLVPI